MSRRKPAPRLDRGWTPVRRQGHAPSKESRAQPDSAGTGWALARSSASAALAFCQLISSPDQPLELLVLLRDAIGAALLVLGARQRRRLLDQLADIVAQDPDAVLELIARKRILIAHGGPPLTCGMSL